MMNSSTNKTNDHGGANKFRRCSDFKGRTATNPMRVTTVKTPRYSIFLLILIILLAMSTPSSSKNQKQNNVNSMTDEEIEQEIIRELMNMNPGQLTATATATTSTTNIDNNNNNRDSNSIIREGRVNVHTSTDGKKVHVHATGRIPMRTTSTTEENGRVSRRLSVNNGDDNSDKMEYISNIMSMISDTEGLKQLDPEMQQQAQQVIQQQIDAALQSLEETMGNNQNNNHNNALTMESSDSNGNNNKRFISIKATTVRSHISKPCADIYKTRCVTMRNVGDCTNPKQRDFMSLYCPMSCDLCNPRINIDHASTNADSTTTTFSIHSTGVPQLLDIPKPLKSKSAANEVLVDLSEDQYYSAESLSKPAATISPMSRRVIDLIRNMERYYKNGLNSSSTATDSNSTSENSQKLMFELCKNRHEQCAIWAIQGLCETKPRSMSETCGPACHLCHYNYSYNHKPSSSSDNSSNKSSTNDFNGLSFGTTPFLRSDLQGLFEAIEANRVVRGWNGIPVVTTPSNTKKQKKKKDKNAQQQSSSSQQQQHRFVPVQHYQPVLYKPRPPPLTETNKFYNRYGQLQESTIPEAYREKEKEIFKKNNPYPGYEDGPIVAQFDSFLNNAECHYLLGLIKLQGVDSKTVKDGFGPPTTDARLLPNKKLHILRTSSRTFLQPSSSTNLDNPARVVNPMLEQILDRIELITGVPRSHIEAPIQFDKFVQGQFHEGQPHSTHRTMAEETLRGSRPPHQHDPNSAPKVTVDELADRWRNGELSEAEAATEEDKLQQAQRNPRVLGLTIFLNDMQQGGHIEGNGDVVFPHLNNIRASPKMGRAMLYPTVLSLETHAVSKGVGNGDVTTTNGEQDRPKSKTRMMVLEGFQDTDDLQVHQDAGVWQEVPEEGDMSDEDGSNSSQKQEDDTPGATIGGLKEDVRTILAHTAVKKGIKYTVTFFLRHSPYYET